MRDGRVAMVNGSSLTPKNDPDDRTSLESQKPKTMVRGHAR